MDDLNLQRRKDLAAALNSELENTDSRLAEIAGRIENESGVFYEKAFMERQSDIRQEIESHKSNMARVGEINKEITAAINSWYEFAKDENKMGRLSFPIIWHFRKRRLLKTIGKLNAEISDIMIKNRFVKEKITNMEHELEIKAVSLARSGDNYHEYESLLEKHELISAELKYLLPTCAQ